MSRSARERAASPSPPAENRPGSKIVEGLELPASWSNPEPEPRPLAGVASFFSRAMGQRNETTPHPQRFGPAPTPPQPEPPMGAARIVDGLEIPDSWSNPPPAPKPFAGVAALIGRSIGDVPEAPVEPLWKSYFKACVAAFTTGMLLFSLSLGGSGEDWLGARLFMNLASAIAMMSIAPALAPLIRIGADLCARLGIRRGWSDVLLGGAFGALMTLPEIATGNPPSLSGLCFIAGGMFGGFVFWRARGYPGLNTSQRRFAEGAHIAMGRARDMM